MLMLLSSLFGVETAQKSNEEILILSSAMGKKRQLRKLELLNEQLSKYDLSVAIVFDKDIKDEKQQRTLFQNRELIIIDALNGKSSTMPMRQKYKKLFDELNSEVVVTGVDSANSLNLENLFVEQLLLYLENGGKHNYAQIATLLANKILDQKNSIKEPIIIPKSGIYNHLKRDISYDSLDKYLAALNEKERNQPMVGIAIHKANIVSDDTDFIDQSIEMFMQNDITPIVFFTEVGKEDFAGERFFTKDGKVLIDLLISYQIMIMDQEKLKLAYERLGIPIMQGIIFREGEQSDWEESKQGIVGNWIPMMYTIPETIGYTDPLVIAAIDKKSKKAVVIDYQLESFISKAVKLSKLNHIPQDEKRVSIFYYNYPPGVNNFGASFMNFPASIEKISKAMQESGYTTQTKDEKHYLKAFARSMAFYYEKTAPDANNTYSDLLPAEEYEAFFTALPKEVQENINDTHGSYKESDLYIKVNNKAYFIIPRVKSGNVMYLPQPSRSTFSGDREKSLYHDKKTPLPHHYFAVYLYAKKHSDAFVHLGTHGTHEWSYGKERGLSVYDSGMLAIGDTPLFYPYITNNLAEGIQAKRRGRATLISHQTPPFGISGIYKELSDIFSLIDAYNASSDDVQKENFKKLKELTIKMNIHKDMKYTVEMIDADKEAFVADLYDNLNGISASYTPLGMHTYGSYPDDDKMVQTIMAMLGDKFVHAMDGEEGLNGINYNDINKTKSYKVLYETLIENKSIDSYEASTQSFLKVAKEFQKNFVQNEEIKSLLDALNGKYIKTSGGGDPIRNPESLPTGRNMYAFDPDKIPTKAAYESGKNLMKSYIENYYAKNGRYPNKLTFNLWSLETMRHFGVLESQILYAMGVKPIWSEGGINDTMLQSMAFGTLNGFLPEAMAKWCASFVTVQRVDFFSFLMPDKMKSMFEQGIKMGRGNLEGVEVIPYSELKRPRIDVVVQATGLYRDAFPTVMDLINKGVMKITELKEEHNYLRANSLAFKEELLKKGYSEENATIFSTVRMFSAAQGEYGNGMKDTSQESDTWEDESKLADNFIRKSGYMYGSDKSTWGTRLDDVDMFSKNLSGTDAVVFSRTSNLYGLMTSDDPFGYFGSLALAVRSIDGKSPDMVLANLRNPDKAKMQDVDEFISNELRTRYFNPKWIKAMQEVGYSGTTNILDVTNNFWGWQVVYPDGVRSDQWQEFVEVYVNDKYELGTREWFKNSNPTALAQMSEKILEAVRKGYFQTDAKTIKRLIETQAEFAKSTNHEVQNEKLKEFIKEEIAAGYGLSIEIAKPVATAQEAQANPQPKSKPQIQGQKLEEKAQNKQEESEFEFEYLWFALAFLMLIGVLLERRKY